MTFSGWDYFGFPCFLALLGFLLLLKVMIAAARKNAAGSHVYWGIAGLMLAMTLVIGAGACVLYWGLSPFFGLPELSNTGSRMAGGQVQAVRELQVPYVAISHGQFARGLEITLEDGRQFVTLSPGAPEIGDWVRLEYVPEGGIVLAQEVTTQQEALAVITEPLPTPEELQSIRDSRHRQHDDRMGVMMDAIGFPLLAVVFIQIGLSRLWEPRLTQWVLNHEPRHSRVEPRWYGALIWGPLAVPVICSMLVLVLNGYWAELFLPLMAAVPVLFHIISINTTRLEYSTSRITVHRLRRTDTYRIQEIDRFYMDRNGELRLTFRNGDRVVLPLQGYQGVRTLYEVLKKHPYLQ